MATVKLQLPLQTRLLTTFHQLETMHENYHIFTSSPSCCASVMKQNVNSTILISKKDSQNSENLISENLISSRQRYQKGTFPRNFFKEFSD